MCSMKSHKCYCGKEYPCSYPNFACPTINEDEDMNQCDECIDKFTTEYRNAYEDEFFEDEEFDEKD